MNKKFLFIFTLILIITLSAVSATEDLNQANENSDAILTDANGNFEELQNKISNAEDNSTIELDSNYVYNDEEFSEGIIINKNITINGNGHTIDGNYATRIFYINATNVFLNNITFINGWTQDSGGAIIDRDINLDFMYGPQNIEINDCTFINCAANTFGGAIYLNHNLSIRNSDFINNSAGCGGAVFIWNDFNNFLIENSRFLNNFFLADGQSTWVKGGGAIFVGCSKLSIRNSTFTGNRATNDGECGGAVLCYESVTGSMDDSIFLDNHAGKGSTFYFALDSNINVTDSVIDNPFTTNQIYVDGDSSGSYAEFTNVSYDDFKNQSFYVWENTICFKTRIVADTLEKIYGGDERLYIYLTDNNSNPLANEKISVEINGISYSRTTDANGKSSVGINLPVGEYNATFYFDGDEIKYSPCSGMSHITVNTSIYSESYMKKYCKGPEPYEARFLDKNGNYLTQGKAIFNINGVLYERNVKDGTARLNINLEPGNYTITATNPVTGEGKASLIEVLPTIIDNHDLVKYYRNDSQYVVKLDDDLTDKKVTFNINGVFYERYANESGHVKLNINLQPGEYIITAEHNGCRVANNIVVLPVLNASDLEMRYLDGSQFNVTLLDGEGKPYAGQNVTFNVNGVFYVRTTDVNGVAHLNINLMTGEYIITSSYNGSNIANKITISS